MSIKSKIIELNQPEEIFVDIRELPAVILDEFSGRKISLDQYRLIYSCPGGMLIPDDHEFRLLGLGLVPDLMHNDDTNPRSCYWLTNSELLKLMAGLVYRLLPDQVTTRVDHPLYPGNFRAADVFRFLKTRAFTIEPDRAWYSLLVDLSAIRSLFEGTHLYQNIEELDHEGYRLFLTAENAFGQDASPNVYLQIMANGFNTKEPTSYLSGFLTLDKTNLKQKTQKEPTKLKAIFENYSSAFDDFITVQARTFAGQLDNFASLFRIMRKLKLDPEMYNALALDLYDRNRNKLSFRHDRDLQRLIRNTLERVHPSEYERDFTWATLIRRVVELNAETIRRRIHNNPEHITHVFSKKKVIEKMQNIYDSIRSANSPEEYRRAMQAYLESQMESYWEIRPFLEK